MSVLAIGVIAATDRESEECSDAGGSGGDGSSGCDGHGGDDRAHSFS